MIPYTAERSARYCELCGAERGCDNEHTADNVNAYDAIRVINGYAAIDPFFPAVLFLKINNPDITIRETAAALRCNKKRIVRLISRMSEMGSVFARLLHGNNFNRHVAQSNRREKQG